MILVLVMVRGNNTRRLWRCVQGGDIAILSHDVAIQVKVLDTCSCDSQLESGVLSTGKYYQVRTQFTVLIRGPPTPPHDHSFQLLPHSSATTPKRATPPLPTRSPAPPSVRRAPTHRSRQHPTYGGRARTDDTPVMGVAPGGCGARGRRGQGTCHPVGGVEDGGVALALKVGVSVGEAVGFEVACMGGEDCLVVAASWDKYHTEGSRIGVRAGVG